MRNTLGPPDGVHDSSAVKSRWPDEFQPLVRKRYHHRVEETWNHRTVSRLKSSSWQCELRLGSTIFQPGTNQPYYENRHRLATINKNMITQNSTNNYKNINQKSDRKLSTRTTRTPTTLTTWISDEHNWLAPITTIGPLVEGRVDSQSAI